MAQEDADQSAASIGTSALLDGLEGEARRDRAELVAWLMRRGFTADEIAASVTPMLLPANRAMDDHMMYRSRPCTGASRGTNIPGVN
jgi:adenylate cyclase